MKSINDKFQQMMASVPKEVSVEIDISFAIANEINSLMHERGLTKKQFADALGKKPSEITKWLSGQHNFTIRTLAILSTFFGKPLITVGSPKYSLPDDNQAAMVAEEVTPYNKTLSLQK